VHPAIQAIVICGVAAGLEGALAGSGVRARFRELRQPSFSPPLALWFVIGAVYYVICFALLYRLLGSGWPTVAHRAAFYLLLALMIMNAAWGWLFFRRKDLRGSMLAFVPYALLALALTIVLARSDRTAALLFLPYLLYLGYALWWSPCTRPLRTAVH
jgi:tryptophan-rich sensory protein